MDMAGVAGGVGAGRNLIQVKATKRARGRCPQKVGCLPRSKFLGRTSAYAIRGLIRVKTQLRAHCDSWPRLWESVKGLLPSAALLIASCFARCYLDEEQLVSLGMMASNRVSSRRLPGALFRPEPPDQPGDSGRGLMVRQGVRACRYRSTDGLTGPAATPIAT